MKVALLISTYNWPEALSLVLKSVTHQNLFPDEILIADDGSTEETANVIRKYSEKINLPIQHVWQKDEGFRKAVILNKTIAKSNADYVIQIDGDCVMHKNFIRDHLKNSRSGVYLFGSRVNIQENYLTTMFSKQKIDYKWFSKGISKRTRSIYLPYLSGFYKEKNQLSGKLRGCNFSFWKQDFLDINGYNEDITGWGKEDSELAVRLLNSGVKAKRLRYAGIIYHIWHQEKSREKRILNEGIQNTAIDKKLIRCSNGVDQYLK
ncbi:glycosyltransferase family 2 protein [Autumnicola musiva]|uniref:Glycosyltransferase family 2 protein n=1 Tax=Autumnicola musiva TaxID=3075589 RepID=A0ABU3D3K2_9FLAO|nr:glycosyltransferase family 2 protein [Zunongwangia sp. F117]MDT0675981.1 glycosyltransferase family 2 protein [Zunongwangia sp. F117]